MPYLHTMQSCYEPLRSDVTIGDTAYLDGSTSGRTFDYSDRPSYAKALTPNHNAVEIIAKVTGDAVDGNTFSFRLWGWTANGPAERIADISATTGTANIGDLTTALWVDTFVVSTDSNIATCSATDTAANRISKLTFDTVGYTWIAADFTNHAVDLSQKVTILYRPY